MLRVAVDFGTSSTVTVFSTGGPVAQVVVIDGGPLLSSGVFGAADGTLFVGRDAEQQAAVDPSRYEPNPKRHLDEGEFLLGDTVFKAVDVVRAVLARAVGEAGTAGRAPVGQLVLTHPAQWAATRIGVLREAASGLAGTVELVPEPVAAAVFHAGRHPLEPGRALAVVDLGAGTVDASVVARTATGFEVLASRGDPHFGGADVDQAILDHLGTTVGAADQRAWQRILSGQDLRQRRLLRTLRADVRAAKEALSRHSYADVPMPAPFADAHLGRPDVERLIEDRVRETIRTLSRTLLDSGVDESMVSRIFLVGGSSRIPLVSRLIHEVTGRVPVTLDQPETVVARGALDAVAVPVGKPRTRTATPTARPRPGLPRAPGPRDVPPPAGAGFTPGPVRPPPGGPVARDPSGPRREVSPSHPTPVGAPPWIVARPLPARRSSRTWLVLSLVTVLVVAAGGLGWWAWWPPAGREITRFDYRFTVPADWGVVGEDGALRQVTLKPNAAPTGSNAIVVQEFQLAFDADGQPDRAENELRRLVDGAGLTGFTPRVEFAGLPFARYQERRQAVTVDWYVRFQGGLQVSVGCGYLPEARSMVVAACEGVARTVRLGH